MDYIMKRVAVLARAYRDGRLHLDEVLAWGVEAGLDREGCVALMERCADSEPGLTRDERLTSLLVNAYRNDRLHIDEALYCAVEADLNEDCLALMEGCMDTEAGDTRDQRLTNLLVKAYRRMRLHIDEVLVWAGALNSRDPEALLDLCGESDLAV